MTAASVELADKLSERNRALNELEKSNKALASLQETLDEYVSNLVKQLGIELINNKNRENELRSIKSSKGYRLISKFWKIKSMVRA